MFGLFRKRLSAAQRWALAAGGVLIENNGDPFDRISLRYGKAASRVVLTDWWGVQDRKTLLEQLGWLEEQGHRMDLRAELPRIAALVRRRQDQEAVELSKHEEFVVNNFPMLKKTAFEAWDGSRLIAVARWGLASDYILEHEAWTWIMTAAKSMRLRLGSWQEVGDDFVLGYRYWSLDGIPIPSMFEAHARLTTNPDSPWKSIEWTIDPDLLTA